jgi:microcompartment protein CcmL/EutN
MDAMGMIETYGLLASIEAADIMLKTADVRLLSQTKVGGGLVAVFVTGDVGAVKASVEAGLTAASKLGRVRSAHVIPRPVNEIGDMFRGRKEDKASGEGAEPPEDLEKMKVTEMRSLLRKMRGKTLTPEEIKYANRKTLLNAIREAKNNKQGD